MEGQAEVIAPTKKIRRPKAELPEINLRRTKSLFEPYLEKAKKLGSLRTGVIYPVRERVIEAVDAAHQAGYIDPILIGPKERIQHAAEKAGININKYEIIHVEHGHAAVNKAVAMAREDEVGMLVRGGVPRGDLLDAMQRPDIGLTTDLLLSYAAVFDVPTYSKALILTDTLINIDPNLEEKRAITQNAIDFALALGIEEPKVAVVAGMNSVNYSMRSTVDAAALCKMAERGQLRRGILDGPLTFDNAISMEVAKAKGIKSPVIGNADILVLPNVETGNILSEQLEYLAEARNAGIVLGGRVPVLMGHIYDIQLSTVSCALAIIEKHSRGQRGN